eukprot:CAMPEP_0172168734 /NCGR_PEP_ID=MMETSP1050-20130122/10313_1 /TAXON_ID=233186 /ORGANISM="Cryptomonas curvata, Strain CCAP979/52" /LENGTH=115 /DNA_ID=CAMNT_0012839711 /DNA_START=86 /DNA_END=433 /DNA_ORIENTATION=-
MVNKLQGKRLVGSDNNGNKFWEIDDGGSKPRREIEYNQDMVEFDPLSVPAEWRMWAKGQLKTAPTPEEIARSEAIRANTLKLAHELDEEEAKRKVAVAAEAGPQAPSTWDPNQRN